MKELPCPEVYEKEMVFLPWGNTISKILDFCLKAPQNFKVLDLMCGIGYLLGKIAEKRKDLELTGVDINERFIEYARKNYPGINFIQRDVLDWEPDGVYDIILCTGALHHLPYSTQPVLLEKIARWLNSDSHGAFVLAENFLRYSINEEERKKTALEYGRYYLAAAREKNAPPEIIKAVLDFIYNDVQGFEYKRSLYDMNVLLGYYFHDGFKKHEVIMFGDERAQVGDYVIILENLKLKRA